MAQNTTNEEYDVETKTDEEKQLYNTPTPTIEQCDVRSEIKILIKI